MPPEGPDGPEAADVPETPDVPGMRGAPETSGAEPPEPPAPAARPTGYALPPNPDKYDAPRNIAARNRGLEQPYIAGGEDPELAATLRRERRYVRLLVGMAVGIVFLGFALGILGALLSAALGT